MRIIINEPDGRFSGLVLGDTYGIHYNKHFRFKELEGKSGSDSLPMIEQALQAVAADGLDGEEQLVAGRTLQILATLRDMAEKNPDGIWKVV